MRKWHVWSPFDSETREDADEVEAANCEEAVEYWAASGYDPKNDYQIAAHGREIDVWVAPVDGSSEPVEVTLSGECIPEYTAMRKP